MKKLFFMLAFMLVGVLGFATSNIESNLINSEVLAENKTLEKSVVVDLEFNLSAEAIAATYYCYVEDGHFAGEGYGNSMAQACRRAKRALKKDEKAPIAR